MKKAITLIVLLLLIFTLAACNGATPPGSSWADMEILEYSVKIDGEDAGTMTSTIKRNLTAEDKTINGTAYNRATSKVTISYTYDDESLIVESLLYDFSPLATYKKVVTENKSYELSSYYMDKHYHYNLNEDGEENIGRIKTKTEYIDNDLLYTYIRTQNLSGLNKTLNIPSAKLGELQSVRVASAGSEKINVPFPGGAKMIDCHKIAITRNATPVGKSIFVYFTPDKPEYLIAGGLSSIHDSRKIPVRIEEHDVVYELTKITVS